VWAMAMVHQFYNQRRRETRWYVNHPSLSIIRERTATVIAFRRRGAETPFPNGVGMSSG